MSARDTHPSVRTILPEILLPVLEQFSEGVIIADAVGVIVYMNPKQAEMDDLERGDVLGRQVTEVYRVDAGVSPTMQCLNSGTPVINLACYYRTRLGKVVNSIHNVYPLTEGRRIIGSICFIRDFQLIEKTLDAVSKPRRQQRFQAFDIRSVIHRERRFDNGTRFLFSDIIGDDPDFADAVHLARLSADSSSPVMVMGETGTGKELLAQSIHNRSPRKQQQYVAVNCAAIPENLLEGILFGTSRGAFTGAEDKAGLFETANGGTLFLDELNAMPVSLQAKLLRAVQERRIRRVGSLKEIDIELKIISSVNREPHQAIEDGTLRPDLLYRLGVVFIRIPPLRERMGDLEKLVAHFLKKCGATLGKRVNRISLDVLDAFERYHWPGNVRELEHVIEGAMNIVQDNETIDMRHLSVHISRFETVAVPGAAASAGAVSKGRADMVFPEDAPSAPAPPKKLAQIQAESEIASIEAALRNARGNGAQAARALGMSPQLLHYKLKRYGIDRKSFRSG